MPKHGNINYLQVSRLLFNEEPYKSLSNNAKWLYVILKELEHRYTGKKEHSFYRSNDELAQDASFSLSTLKRAKAELLSTDLVETWRAHFVYNKGTPQEKLSEKRVAHYRILK